MELSLSKLQSLDFILKSFEIEYGITYKLVFRFGNDIVSADFLSIFENKNNEKVVGEHKTKSREPEFREITEKHVEVVKNNKIQSFININAFADIDQELASKNSGRLYQALIKHIDEFNFNYFESNFVYNVYSLTNDWTLPCLELNIEDIELLSVVRV
ncbi:hypothetical protein BU107_11095 [Staphylococcus xylosus]|uniref:hypothetical protein n=1 Tax=Staphylococcus xylosus TaxID=1288 RepID=UPI000E687F9A|nr:hypothetical protein [Staphylococcus xylosus]RIM85830.1 hypothetical protein BU107_11095 [Staphylococcus xylosus]